jgi:orotidine-5'-phosphate decarboxylase
MTDFTMETASNLKMLAQQHNFIVMEDRKFGDIGNTVKLQYSSPALSLPSGWAGLVTCHALPGPGVVEGLKEVAVEGSGCVVVVEMSSQGSLTTPDYVTGTLRYTYILRQKAFINFVISQNYFPPLIFGVSK